MFIYIFSELLSFQEEVFVNDGAEDQIDTKDEMYRDVVQEMKTHGKRPLVFHRLFLLG